MINVKEVILNKIKEYDSIVIGRHFRPDGDAVGSTMGLGRMISLTFPEKKVYLSNNDKSDYMAFLGDTSDLIEEALLRILLSSSSIPLQKTESRMIGF